MTDQLDRPDGWESVPHTDDLRGTAMSPEAAQPAAGQQATQQYPAQPAPGQQSTRAYAQPYAQYTGIPRATRRRMNRKTLVGIIAGGAAVVLLLVAGTVAYSVGSAAHSPTHEVEAFLDDLEAGHATKALAAAGVKPAKDDVLLTDAAYAKATGKVTDHRIVGVDTSGSGATVSTVLRQGGKSVPARFELTRTGTDLGVFPTWRLDPVTLGSVRVSLQGPANTPLTIGGVRVATDKGGSAMLSALPGSYSVAVDGGGWYQSKSATAVVTGLDGSASNPVSLTTTLTDKGKQAADAAVNSWVDGCIASSSIAPDGCSFYAYGEDPSNTYTNEKWTLGTRPVFGVSDWVQKGWVVRTTTAGSATFTANFTGPSGSGVGEAGPIDVYADGYIAGFTSSGATFVPAVASSGSGDSGS
jgi:hypothetical protein